MITPILKSTHQNKKGIKSKKNCSSPMKVIALKRASTAGPCTCWTAVMKSSPHWNTGSIEHLQSRSVLSNGGVVATDMADVAVIRESASPPSKGS